MSNQLHCEARRSAPDLALSIVPACRFPGVQRLADSIGRFVVRSRVASCMLALALAACSGRSDYRSEPPPAAVGGDVTQYATSFELTENPISEGGRWRRAANRWTNVRTAAGNAFGTNGRSNGYDDSYALLSGFGPDQQAQAVIYRSPELVPDITHEVELLLRFSDGSGQARGYECLFAYFGGVQIVRWNGAMGNFTVLKILRGAERLGRELQSGDRIEAVIRGTLISVYINDELMAEAEDSTYPTGQPGISFFTRPGGNSAHFALSSYTVQSTTR
jgi:hypothetical protein